MGEKKKCRKCGVEKSRSAFYRLKGAQYKEEWDCRDSFCTACRGEYQTERRRAIKILAVKYMGGRCLDCSLVTEHYEVYDFHHLDPSKKEFSPGKVVRAFENMREELKKCVLLCANCHRIRHSSVVSGH